MRYERPGMRATGTRNGRDAIPISPSCATSPSSRGSIHRARPADSRRRSTDPMPPTLPRHVGAAASICAALLAPLTAAAGPAPATADRPTLAVRCARLIDGVGDAPRRDAVVLIEGDRIKAVGGRDILPPGVHVIDLGAATVLPGLVDAHSHPLIGGDDYQIDHLRLSSAAKALRGLKAVQDNLAAGWTTLRIAGDADVFYAHLDVRRAVDDGMFVGPRLCGAGHYISATGGG